MLVAFFFGFAMGFFGAIPVAGPVSAMVVERALDKRFAAGLLLAAGSSIAEGFYAALAVLGFSALADHPWVAPASKLVAGVVLIALGLVFSRRRARPSAPDLDDATPHRTESLPREALLGFTVTIVNPTLLATWAAATSMLMASEWTTHTPLTSLPFGVAVALGATAWFALLLLIVRRFARDLKPASVQRIIRTLGWVLVGLGGWFIVLFVRAVA